MPRHYELIKGKHRDQADFFRGRDGIGLEALADLVVTDYSDASGYTADWRDRHPEAAYAARLIGKYSGSRSAAIGDRIDFLRYVVTEDGFASTAICAAMEHYAAAHGYTDNWRITHPEARRAVELVDAHTRKRCAGRRANDAV